MGLVCLYLACLVRIIESLVVQGFAESLQLDGQCTIGYDIASICVGGKESLVHTACMISQGTITPQ